jgi:hypothetical protein
MVNYFFYLLLFPLATFFFSNDRTLEIISVNAESPNVTIFPECGTTSDNKILFIVNGFNPNGNVHWELVKSNGDIDSYGYFDTDISGNFEEFINAEEMEADTYTLRLFDDINHDFIKDFDGSEVILNYDIPCDSDVF